MKKAWWKELVVYQVYPRSFKDSDGDGIGDLAGLIEKLDYLKDLGIGMIWICPMYKTPNIDNGYDISDYQSIMEEMGTMETFDRLLAEVHQRGMRLIIDLVINHTSDQHPWFLESRSSRESPKRDWYIWRDEPTNWESIFHGPAWSFDEGTQQYYLHLFTDNQPDLNWENPDVRSALYGMINWWLDKGIDGFRIDAISHIKKDLRDMPVKKGEDYVPAWPRMTDVKGIQVFLKELREATFDHYDIMTIGEANGVRSHNLHEWISEAEGKFNMIFHFEAHDVWDQEGSGAIEVRELEKVLTRWQKVTHGIAWNSLYLENHDRPRVVSTWGNDGQYWRESATAFASMYFFMQGTPFIYQGQEIGMTNAPFDNIHQYKDVWAQNFYFYKMKEGMPHKQLMDILKKTSRDHARTPMQWDGSPNAGFSTAEPWIETNPNYRWLNVEQQEQDPHSVLSFYKKMIRMRSEHEILIYGRYDLFDFGCPSIYAYTRTYQKRQMLIVANLWHFPCEWTPPENADLLLGNYENGAANELGPYETRIFEIEDGDIRKPHPPPELEEPAL